jgi:hypothetical protein
MGALDGLPTRSGEQRIQWAARDAVEDRRPGVGIALGEPYSSALKGTKHPLRKLRPKRGASPLRIIYAFDPEREALLLIGGEKGNDKRFYERAIPKAERLWEAHLEQLEKEGER